MVVDAKLCLLLKSYPPRALFAMARRFEQEYAAQRSDILCLLLLRNQEYDGSKMAAAFLATSSSHCGVFTLSLNTVPSPHKSPPLRPRGTLVLYLT